MTVDELIAELMSMNPDEEVMMNGGDGVEYIDRVEVGPEGIIFIRTERGV